MTRVYISPHLDDAVFSCAAGIIASRAAGRRVVVITVFTADQPRRQAEDRAALASVGVDAIHLDFPDAPVRLGVTPSFRSLVLEAQPHPAEVELITRALQSHLDAIEPTESIWPLGIGGHIDHRTVFAASRAVTHPVRYYDDRPYAFVPAWSELRRLELEGGRMPTPPDAAELRRQIEAGGCGALLGDVERTHCLRALATRCATSHAESGLSLRAEHRHYPGHGPAALRLLSHYRSQIEWISEGGSEPWPWTRHAGLDGATPTERETTLSAS